MVAPPRVANFVKLRLILTEFGRDLEIMELHLLMLPGFTEENATLRLKLERMHSVTTRFQSESDTAYVIMDEIQALPDKKKDEMREVTNL